MRTWHQISHTKKVEVNHEGHLKVSLPRRTSDPQVQRETEDMVSKYEVEIYWRRHWCKPQVTHTNAAMKTHTHGCENKYTHAHTCMFLQMCIGTETQTYIYMHANTYPHTHRHMQTHAYIHTNTQTHHTHRNTLKLHSFDYLKMVWWCLYFHCATIFLIWILPII